MTYEIRDTITVAATRHIRPSVMILATTMIAVLPVLTPVGHGSDILIPMAITSFGGIVIAVINVFMVPVLYCIYKERHLDKNTGNRKEENLIGVAMSSRSGCIH